MSKDREGLRQRILKEINFRYFLAVGLIATFSIITFLLNQNLHEKMQEDFKVINLSGRQRMLTQRIALLSGTQRPEILKTSISEYNYGLNYLLNSRFVKPEYKDVYQLYHGDDQLVALNTRYLELALRNNLSQTDRDNLFLISQELLKKFDQTTLETQHISEIESKNRIRLEFIFLTITLLILAIEVIFIFRPMVKRVREGFTELNRIEDKSLMASRLSMIGEIASSIGHEIKNPLSIIMIYAKQGLKSTQEDPNEMKSHSQFSIITKNAEKINKIVKALGVQARETSQDPMTEAPLRDIVDDAIEMFAAKMKYQDIKLTTDFKYDGELHCRPAAISQVVANLISNAIDAISEQHTQHREIKIESEEKNHEIILRVIDSGPGVPEDKREMIFESFMTTKQADKGTGLGLAISRKIMHAHGGEIYLNPKIANTCFEMKFSQ